MWVCSPRGTVILPHNDLSKYRIWVVSCVLNALLSTHGFTRKMKKPFFGTVPKNAAGNVKNS
jgi:hypothetical protein